MNTIPYPIAVAITVVVFFILRAALLNARNNGFDVLDDIRELRHTIDVNCGILVSELEELSGIAKRAIPSLAVSDAKKLLQNASLVADTVPQRINCTDKESLGLLLTEVFDAMNKSTSARRLLGACHLPSSYTQSFE